MGVAGSESKENMSKVDNIGIGNLAWSVFILCTNPKPITGLDICGSGLSKFILVFVLHLVMWCVSYRSRSFWKMNWMMKSFLMIRSIKLIITMNLT